VVRFAAYADAGRTRTVGESDPEKEPRVATDDAVYSGRRGEGPRMSYRRWVDTPGGFSERSDRLA